MFKRSLKIKVLSAGFIFLVFTLSADIGMAGASLPYSYAWFKNPALENRSMPKQIFTSPIVLPAGYLILLNPSVFPYEIFDGGISGDKDFDLLSLYVQFSNPGIAILNPPKSPDWVKFYISKNKISIVDQNGNPIPIISIPGRESVSIMNTALIPPPLFTYRTGSKNLKFGIGLFSGTSGISFKPNETFTETLEGNEINPGDLISVDVDFSSRSGIFEYLNVISNVIPISENLNLEVAGRISFYQTLAEFDATLSSSAKFTEDTILTEMENRMSLFYYYPGEGIGIGSRFDAGTLLTSRNWIFGLSILNLLGLEYTRGVQVIDQVSDRRDNLFYSFSPLLFFHSAYTWNLRKNIIVIPVVESGYGKNFFITSALAVIVDNLSFKTGITYEGRWKAALGAGIKLGSYTIETDFIVQQTVFMKTLFGLSASIGFKR